MIFTSLRSSDKKFYEACVSSKSNDSRPRTGMASKVYDFACYHGDVRVDALRSALIIELSGKVMVYNMKINRLLLEDKACRRGAEYILSFYKEDADVNDI